jgi:carboxymethylenebutenolidase
VHEHIKDMCRRFAKQGYYAIAPEMYAHQGDVSKMTDIGAILSTVVSKVPDAQVTSDLDAAVAFAGASGQADASRVGLVGYCWGGRVAWVYAHHNPKLKAAVAYYGLLDGMQSPIRPQDPVDMAANIKVPVLGLYAGIDGFIKPEVVDRMTAGLRKSGSGSEIVVFPNVNHGFNADYRPTYDKTAATYATKLTLDWLKERV